MYGKPVRARRSIASLYTSTLRDMVAKPRGKPSDTMPSYCLYTMYWFSGTSV